MKDGTRYAGTFKRAFARLRHSAPKLDAPVDQEPIRRLAVGILGVECGEKAAERALNRAFEKFIDWNELRVSSPEELHRAIGDNIPNAKLRCQNLLNALQAIYDKENRVSLDRLRNMGRREARQYLESLPGVDEYASAYATLWSLGGHAIPVHDSLLAALRASNLVHPEATRAQVQAFLERHVSASDAKETCQILESLVRGKGARSTKKAPVASRRKAK